MKVGDKVIQIVYDWGKKKDGSYFIFEVKEIHLNNVVNRITCTIYDSDWIPNLTDPGINYIPINTWKQLAKVREELIDKIIED